jgi:DNA ligase 1
MLTLRDLADTSRAVADTRSRNTKIARLAELLRAVDPDEAAIAVGWLTGDLLQGRIGVGPAAVRNARAVTPAATPTLSAAETDAVFTRIAGMGGAGSTAARAHALRSIFERATADEQDFIARLLWGELRQGALEGVMADALARAGGAARRHVRRAAQHAGDLPSVARAVLSPAALTRCARSACAVPAAAADAGAAGTRSWTTRCTARPRRARLQARRRQGAGPPLGDEVRVYTRRLNEVTEFGAGARGNGCSRCPPTEIVLDGEAIALREDGRPQPFQVTMSRFGSRVDVQRLRADVPLSVVFFDCLYLDGQSLLDEPASRRFEVMQRLLPPDLGVPSAQSPQS